MVPQGKSENLADKAAVDIESGPVSTPIVRREPILNVAPNYAEKNQLHHDKSAENLPRAATMVIEPKSAPHPTPPPRLEIAVPDTPPMYAENGRLRLSGITLEQIQQRDPRIRRPRVMPKQT